MIFLRNVAKFFEGKPLIENVNVSVHRGDRVGVVGPNGAGKSTLLGMMEGTLTPDDGEISVEKRIRMGVLHQELIAGGDGPILEEVMNVSEDLKRTRERLAELNEKLEDAQELTPEVEVLLEEQGKLQLEFERFDGYTLEARAMKVLAGLGFRESDAQRPWHEFSGGWRMRVALAKILLADPDVLLLDEPTNHLDLESLLWVENYLSDYKGALVIVSHDRAFLNRLVTKILEVDRGKVTSYSGNYDTYEITKEQQETVQLAAFKNQEEKRKRIQKFIDQNRVKARTASRVQSRVKMLEKMETVEAPRSRRTLKFTFPQPDRSGRRVLEIEGLVKKYGEKTVYDGLKLFVDRGEKIGLVGPNGAGKSTLMKIVAGVVPYDDGRVTYGHNVQVGYFAQHQSESLSPERSCLDEAWSASRNATEQEIRTMLGAFLFSGDNVFKKVKVLSGGEKSRLALSKILLSPPNFLLMDEPTNHLDITSCQVLEDAMQAFEGTLILITHDRELMNKICTSIWEVQNGTVEDYPGNYDDYLHKKRLMEKEQERREAEAATVKVPRNNGDSEEKSSRKDRKRKEAEARKANARKRDPLVKEVKRLEAEMAKKEERSREIHEIMADPENYGNRELMLPLLEEEPLLAREIKQMESRWEELQLQLEELDRAAVGEAGR